MGRSALGARLAFLAGASACHAPAAQLERQPIVVRDEMHGCFMPPYPPLRYAWAPVPGGYRLGERFIPEEELAALRARLLTWENPPDLLARVGVDPATLRAHRGEILRAARWGIGGKERALPLTTPELEEALAFEVLAPRILDEVLGRNWGSTTSYDFEVVLPGEPTLTVASGGLTPWMLPWTVTLDGRSRLVADPELSRALLCLADPEGNCAHHLDGARYWETLFWGDDMFWHFAVGEPASRALFHPPSGAGDAHAIGGARE